MSKLFSMFKNDIKNWYLVHLKKMTPMQIKIQLYRKIGMSIGENCHIFSDKIETAEPYLITLGNNITIANDVLFATHDASASFYLENTSDIYGRITIGNHVFIGMGTIILPGVTVANDVIIGAGSVVTKSILEEGIVVAGNPAKKLCTINQLKEKNYEKKLMTWGMTFDEKKEYLLQNEHLFKKS